MIEMINGQHGNIATPAATRGGRTDKSTTSNAAEAKTSQQVMLSRKARLAQQIMQAARASDGVDSAKVSQLRKSIDNGSYKVSAESITQALKATGEKFGTH